MSDAVKEYVICLHAHVVHDDFWNDMETITHSHVYVPDRCVHVVNERMGSLRICHYALTDAEAEVLRQDPRVLSVDIPAHAKPDMELRLDAIQYMNYQKTTGVSGSLANWGLKRCVSDANNYGVSNTSPGGFPYTLDGTGVDVIIMDSGIQPDHPEFQDAQGQSRVQQIDWYLASGIVGNQSPNFYRDFEGHGTHVAAICAGKTYGWAKNARIYAMKLAGLEGAGDAGTGIDLPDCMDIIKLWHSNKNVDPQTGYKRPTVLNMSWGWINRFTNILGGNYRGTPWTGTSRRTDLGMIGSDLVFGARDTPTDVDVTEMVDLGIHVCISAGNYYQKNDVPGGLDYLNYFTKSGTGNIYYHQGSSPSAPGAIRVGSTDTTVFDASTEYKSVFSDCGPAVDVWAPGSYIISAVSSTNAYTGGTANYWANATYKQANLSGTSMSAPQVAGVVSLYVQLNPWATPAQVKQWLVSQSKPVIYSTGSDTDYTNPRSLMGAANTFMYVPYNSEHPLTSEGEVLWTALAL